MINYKQVEDTKGDVVKMRWSGKVVAVRGRGQEDGRAKLDDGAREVVDDREGGGGNRSIEQSRQSKKLERKGRLDDRERGWRKWVMEQHGEGRVKERKGGLVGGEKRMVEQGRREDKEAG